MLSCGTKILPSIQALTTHMNTRHKSEHRSCVFGDCETRFNPNSNSRNHFRLKHYNLKKTKLKNIHIIGPVSAQSFDVPENLPQASDTLQPDTAGDVLHEQDSDLDDEFEDDGYQDYEEVDDNQEADDCHLMAYADFINRLITYKFIPVTSVKEIAAEFYCQSKRSNELKEKILRDSLKKIPLSVKQIEQIVEANSKDPFTMAQEELASEFKRNKFMEDNFKFVKPKEIVLNKDEVKMGASKDCVHYVPIVETLKVLLEDSTFTNVVSMHENDIKDGDKEMLKDVKDGKVYKDSKFFKDNPDAFAIMLYSDGVELTNPLSSGKGKHKIVQMFWTLCEVPKYHRSAIDKIQLALVFKEKLLKKYSPKVIFGSLLTDLKTLETTGVEVFEPVRRRVKAGMLLYSGDNLESHTVGGFSVCFSSRDVCR